MGGGGDVKATGVRAASDGEECRRSGLLVAAPDASDCRTRYRTFEML
jgi:hypothetical protein